MNLKEILLTTDQIEAIKNSENPSEENPFIVLEDVENYDAKSNGLSSTTSDIFVDKLTFNIDLESGITKDFIIEWSFKIWNSIGNGIETILLLNDEEIDGDYCFIAGGGNNTFRLRTGFRKESLSGENTIKIQFRRDIGGSAKIKQAKLLLRRVK